MKSRSTAEPLTHGRLLSLEGGIAHAELDQPILSAERKTLRLRTDGGVLQVLGRACWQEQRELAAVWLVALAVHEAESLPQA